MNRSQPDLSLPQILEEAQHRWLRPIEVCGILMNHNMFKLEEEPPLKPCGGSFFLYDRKAVRYFRKDGHSWRKKKDGKTVKEAHERLKAGSKEVLHCYYAHGEENEHFQRRSYWLLERDMENIVFVHYRDVKKENKTQVFPSFNEHVEGTSYRSQKIIPSLPQVSTLVSLEVFNQVSSPSASEHSLPLLSPCYDGYDSSDDPEQSVISDHELPGRSYHASETNSKSCTEDDRMASTESSLFCAQKSLHKIDDKMTDVLASRLGGNSITVDVTSDQKPFLSLSDPSHTVNQTKSFTWEKSEISGNLMVSRKKKTKPPITRTCMPYQNSSIQDHSLVQSVSDLSSSLVEKSGTTALLMAPFGTRNMLTGLVTNSQDKGISDVQEKTSYSKESGDQHQNDSHGHMSSEQFGYETSYQMPFISIKSEAPKSHNYQMQKCMIKQKQKQDFLSPYEQNKVCAAATTKNTSHPLYSQIFTDFQDDTHLQQEEQESLKKIDSFGRCMYQEIAAMGETPFFGVSLDSATHFTEAFDEKTVRSEDPAGTQLSVGLSLSFPRKKCFNILDFSPGHAFSTEETKVLITGEFLESLEDTIECKWFCVFDNFEVPAELLCPGVLRTKAPSHAPGRVPLFITRGDGVSCSNTREFCYLASSEHPSKNFTCLKRDEQDMLFQIRFSMLLSDISQTHASKSFPSKRDTLTMNTDEWTQLEHASVCGDSVLSTIKENLVQQLLKEKLHDMQISNVLSKGELILDKNGLGVLHMGAALGYDWVIGPLLSSGCVNINFRDARGWTALHWAANCGREKTVVALLAAGADPGVKTDPTPEFPAGQTPADLASGCGHKGIAGYLAESSLTGHLSTLTFRDGKISKISASIADRSAVDTVSERTSIKFGSAESEGQATMQDSLAAMRNATQAAARIQFALRALSFERRQEVEKSGQDEYGISDGEIQHMLALKKPPRNFQSAREEDMQSAAIRIQQKFRSWKGRRDFLLFRQRIVKIQAHIRGHQVRQQYKKITWSVGILEKAILRWRRKGKGLRGFHKGTPPISADDIQMHRPEEDDFLKVGRKQIEAGIEKALARVHSMVKSPEAREQYRRLLNDFELAKAHLDSGLLFESSSFAADYTSCTPMSEM